MSYSQLTQEQRYLIYHLLKMGFNQTYTAKIIGVHKSTIGRELKRNTGKKGYRYKQAQRKARQRRHQGRERLTDKDWEVVEDYLGKDFSPEQVSTWIQKKHGLQISHKWIYQLLPASHQSLLFSATMSKQINNLVQKMLYDPITVEISISEPLKTINHAIYKVEQFHKLELLLQLLNDAKKGQVLVFTRTKRRASKLADQLNRAGVNSTSLQGNLSQSKRQKAMNAFRKGQVKVLVATDIAARGIDVMQVTHVINYDIPDTAIAYTHRTGRTGRMDNLGTALTLVTREDMKMVHSIERLIGTNLEQRKVKGFKPTPHVNHPQPAYHQRSRSAKRH